MVCLRRSIGDALEHTFMKSFTQWTENDKSAQHLPDFIIRDTFGIETKASYFKYGAQIKEYQINAFPQLKIPVFYMIGYHTYSDSEKRWATVQNPVRDLKRHFDLDSVYFVSDSVLQRMFHFEKRLSKTAQKYQLNKEPIPPQLPQWYFGLKNRYINQLINNEVSKRNTNNVNVRDYYGITDTEFDFFTLDQTSLKVSQSRTRVLPVRCIVEHNLVELVSSYFTQNQHK